MYQRILLSMKVKRIGRSQQRLIFLAAIVAIYSAFVIHLNFLQGPAVWDEIHYWETSLLFSDRLIPSSDNFAQYSELSTPLPFVAFGALEYLFGQGIAAGRWLNLLLSIVVVFIIGWPGKHKTGLSLVCLVGLFTFQPYLWLSGRLYTEMVACFWVLIGMVSYVRNRHLLSSVAFILAIAARQYMIAFPAAIALCEFTALFTHGLRYLRSASLADHWRWIAPLIAVLSIFGWFYLFQGVASESALAKPGTPDVQRSAWALSPGGAIHFLAAVGAYIVIPEFFLFQPLARLRQWRQQWQKIALIAVGLLLYIGMFPPVLEGLGKIAGFAGDLSQYNLSMLFFFSLSLLACIRFSNVSLMSAIFLVHAVLMMKAYPWDKYVLPALLVFWYLKSLGLEERFRPRIVGSGRETGDRRQEKGDRGQHVANLRN